MTRVSYTFTSATRTYKMSSKSEYPLSSSSSLLSKSIALSKLSKYMASRDVVGQSCRVDEAMELWLMC